MNLQSPAVFTAQGTINPQISAQQRQLFRNMLEKKR
jgi:hypothetical protein